MTDHLTNVELTRLMQGEVSPTHEPKLHQHLDTCEICAAALEKMAGNVQVQEEVASLLRADEFGDTVPYRDECSATDFVVEHLEPADSPDALGRLGSYDILEIIGRGGMGVVLKGYDRELKRFVAIKALAPHLAHSSLARKRFAREAQAAAAVVNSHVIAIHQVQPIGRLPFLVMPLLTGESLAQRLKSRGVLELKEVLRIGMQAAEGLAAAHDQGLVHRDVKPANILLEKGIERAVLTDFGLARTADDVSLTRMGVIAGTPEYMSPEQARGETVDARSDLFSLGCVLYEMATGVSPFRTETPMATLRRIVDEPPRSMALLNPELPRWFVAIVERLLSKNPEQRYATARHVCDLLAKCLAHLHQPTTEALPEELTMETVVTPKLCWHRLSDNGPQLIWGRVALLVLSFTVAVLATMSVMNWAFAMNIRWILLPFTLLFQYAGIVTTIELERQRALAGHWRFRLGLKSIVIIMALFAGAMALITKDVQNALKVIAKPPIEFVFPNGAHVDGGDATVFYMRNADRVEFVLFHAGRFKSTTSSTGNKERGDIALENGQSFGFDREPPFSQLLRINGKEYDLNQGRVLELLNDGSVRQDLLFPTLETAKSPAEVKRLIEEHVVMNEKPESLQQLQRQLKLVQAHEKALLEVLAETHPMVTQNREKQRALQERITVMNEEPENVRLQKELERLQRIEQELSKRLPKTHPSLVENLEKQRVLQERIQAAADKEAAMKQEAAKNPWSETFLGLRIRITAPPDATYQHDQALPLAVELQNVSDSPVRFTDLLPYGDIMINDEKGNRLGLVTREASMPPWEGVDGELKPQQSLNWTIHFERMRLLKPSTGKAVTVQISIPRQSKEPGKLPNTVYSPPVTIAVKDQPLTVKHNRLSDAMPRVKDTWTTGVEGMDIAYREHGGLKGPSYALHIGQDGQAKLVVYQNWKFKSRISDKLSTEKLNQLAAALKKSRFWEGKSDGPPLIDAPQSQFCIAYGGAAFVGEYSVNVNAPEPYRAFHELMQATLKEMQDHISLSEKKTAWGRMDIDGEYQAGLRRVTDEKLPSGRVELDVVVRNVGKVRSQLLLSSTEWFEGSLKGIKIMAVPGGVNPDSMKPQPFNPDEERIIGRVIVARKDLAGKNDIQVDPGTYHLQLDPAVRHMSMRPPKTPYPEDTRFPHLETGAVRFEISEPPGEKSVGESNDPFVVFGRITDESGKPLEGVEVYANCGMGSLVVTGKVKSEADGKYRLPFGPGVMMSNNNSPQGVGTQVATITPVKEFWYETNLHRQGNLLMTDSPVPIKKEVQQEYAGVVEINQPYELNFVMTPGTTVKGYLLNEFGFPVAGQSVSIHGEASCGVLATKQTDGDGQFAFTGVPVKLAGQDERLKWRFGLRPFGVRDNLFSERFMIGSDVPETDRDPIHALNLVSEGDHGGEVSLKLEHKQLTTHPTAVAESPWSEPFFGMRIRMTAPKNAVYRHDEPLPLFVELQIVGDAPVRFADLHRYCRIEIDDAPLGGMPGLGVPGGVPRGLPPGMQLKLGAGYPGTAPKDENSSVPGIPQGQAGAPNVGVPPGMLGDARGVGVPGPGSPGAAPMGGTPGTVPTGPGGPMPGSGYPGTAPTGGSPGTAPTGPGPSGGSPMPGPGDTEQKTLGESATEMRITPWELVEGEIKPQQTLSWVVHFERMRLNKPTTRKWVNVRISIPRQLQEPGKLPTTVYSWPVTIALQDQPLTVGNNRLSDAMPRMKNTWTSGVDGMDITYREHGGLKGPSRAMHIDSNGQVTLVVYENRKLMSRKTAQLNPDKLDQLAASLKKSRFWEGKSGGPPLTDVPEVQFCVAYGGASFVGSYSVPNDAPEAYRAFHELMQTTFKESQEQISLADPSNTFLP